MSRAMLRILTSLMFVAVLLVWSTAARAAECTSTDLAYITLVGPTRIQINDGNPIVATSKLGISRTSSSGTLFLDVRDGAKWTITRAEPKLACQVEFAKWWKKVYAERPLDALGVFHGTLASVHLRKLLESRDDSGKPFRLMIKGGVLPKSAMHACPKGAKERASSSGTDVSDIEVDASGSTLYLATEDADCVAIAQLFRDDREIGLNLGSVGRSLPAAALERFDSPEFEGSDVPCTTVVESATARCGRTLLVPAATGLAERRLAHVRTRFAARLWRDDTCPGQLPEKSNVVPAVDGTVQVCLYANGGWIDAIGAARHPALRGLSLEACAADQPCVAMPSDGLWRLRIGSVEDANVSLSVRSQGASSRALSIRLATAKRYGDFDSPRRERVFMDPVSMMQPGELEKKMCLDNLFRSEDALTPVRTLLTADILDAALPPGELHARSWSNNYEHVCPTGLIASDSVKRRLSELLERGNSIHVVFQLGTRVILDRELIGGDGLRIAAVALYDGGKEPETPATSFRHKPDVVGLGGRLDLGAWLCVAIEDLAPSKIALSVGRFTLLRHDEENALVAGFVESDTDGISALRRSKRLFEKKRIGLGPDNEWYCTSLGASPPLVAKVAGYVGALDRPGTELAIAVDDDDGEHVSPAGRLRSSTGYANFRFALGLEGSSSISTNGVFAVGGGLSLSVFDLGVRATRWLSFSYLRGGFGLYVAAPVATPTSYSFDPTEHPAGDCIAGCDNVQRTVLIGALRSYIGPCLQITPFDLSFSIPLCVGGGVEAAMDSRAGAGVYQTPDGIVTKVGERSDSHFRVGGIGFVTLGMSLAY